MKCAFVRRNYNTVNINFIKNILIKCLKCPILEELIVSHEFKST